MAHIEEKGGGKDQISESAELESDGQTRAIPYEARIEAIREALQRRAAEL